jgi:hypothetical protein
MSGEGKSVSFRRTRETTKSNQELLEEFQKIIYRSRVTTHMKWYGKNHSVELVEHGDEDLPQWQQRDVAIQGTFQFYISVYDSWHQDADLYESYELEDSFVSIAYDFAKANNLKYFPCSFTPEWYEKNEQGQYQHFKVENDNKNIDKICEIWQDATIRNVLVPRYDHSHSTHEAQDQIKQLMTA